MNTSSSTIILIGSGRLARHLRFWNSILQQPNKIYEWNRQHNSAEDLDALLKKSNLVWLAISDSALIPFYENYLNKTSLKVVHFSGALSDSRMMSAHPLMSFPTELMTKDVYQKIHFVLHNTKNLQEAMPSFKNTSTEIMASQKSLYHALCVMTGNFPQHLWNETFKEFKNLNIPNKAVELYIHQITQNFIQFKENALTGPIVRNDRGTLDLNLRSLEKSGLKKIYQTFIEVFVK